MNVEFQDITIASGASSSAEVDLSGGYTLMGAFIPSSITGTGLGISAAVTSGGTFVPVKDGSSDLNVTMAASKYLYFDPKYTGGLRYAKLVSNGTEAGPRTITVAKKQVT